MDFLVGELTNKTKFRMLSFWRDARWKECFTRDGSAWTRILRSRRKIDRNHIWIFDGVFWQANMSPSFFNIQLLVFFECTFFKTMYQFDDFFFPDGYGLHRFTTNWPDVYAKCQGGSSHNLGTLDFWGLGVNWKADGNEPRFPTKILQHRYVEREGADRIFCGFKWIIVDFLYHWTHLMDKDLSWGSWGCWYRSFMTPELTPSFAAAQWSPGRNSTFVADAHVPKAWVPLAAELPKGFFFQTRSFHFFNKILPLGQWISMTQMSRWEPNRHECCISQRVWT